MHQLASHIHAWLRTGIGVKPKILVVDGLGVAVGAGVVSTGSGVAVGVQVGLGVPPPPDQPVEQVRPESMPEIVGVAVAVESVGGTAVNLGTTCTVKDMLPDSFKPSVGMTRVMMRVSGSYSGRIRMVLVGISSVMIRLVNGRNPLLV